MAAFTDRNPWVEEVALAVAAAFRSLPVLDNVALPIAERRGIYLADDQGAARRGSGGAHRLITAGHYRRGASTRLDARAPYEDRDPTVARGAAA